MVNAFVWLNLISIVVLFVLVLNNYKTNPNIIYLGLFLVSFSIFIIASYVTLVEFDPFWAGVLFNYFTPLYLLAGPFFYFYTRGVVEDKFIFKRADFLHFILPFIHLIGVLPFIFSYSFQEKVSILEELHRAPNKFAEFRFNFIFTNAQNMWLRTFSFLSYLLAALIRLLIFMQSQRMPFFILMREQFNLRWLFYLLLSMFFLPLLYIIFLFDVTHFDVGQILLEQKFSLTNGGLILLFSVFINLFNNISLLFFPQLLYGIPKTAPKNYPSSSRTIVSQDDTSTSTPYKNTEYFEDLAAIIKNHMQLQEPFLQKEFSLQMLSNALDVPQHHLTYCIRYFFNSNFSDLKNSYRIAHFKKMAENGIPKHLTIDYLIDKSGFKSKSGFYASFSKLEGYNPSQIVKQI
jgi:AraC-like DNA-binding protein